MKLLLVEDDAAIILGLQYALEKEYEVQVSTTMQDALTNIQTQGFDIVLLDVGLPDGNGFEICKQIKKRMDTPVIFLTAMDDEVNVIMGLDIGGDDYITKPFRMGELQSRIKSVLRRYHKGQNEIHIQDVCVNLKEGKVFKNANEVLLTALEYRLFMVFINHRGQILSRNQLLEGIWDVAGDFVNDNTLSVYIKRLREKLETDMQEPRIIKTVRGRGYIMEKPHVEK